MPQVVVAAVAAKALATAATITFATAFAITSTVISLGTAFVSQRDARKKARRAAAASELAAKQNVAQFLTQEPVQPAHIIYGESSISGNVFFKGFCNTSISGGGGSSYPNTHYIRKTVQVSDMEQISGLNYYVPYDDLQQNNRGLPTDSAYTVNDANTTDTSGNPAADITFTSQSNPVITYGTNEFNEREVTDTNKYFYMLIAIAPHEIESIEEIYIADTKVTLNSAGYVTNDEWQGGQILISDDEGNGIRFVSEYLAKITFKMGGSGQTADTDMVRDFPAHWSTDHIGEGIAYAVCRFLKAGIPEGVPNVRFVVKGKKVYDPRTSTTVFSDNWALCVNDYLRDADLGLNVGSADVDQTTLIAAANTSDEIVKVRGYGKNLIDDARDLSSSTYTQTNTTIDRDSNAGHDGQNKADLMQETSATGVHTTSFTFDVTNGRSYEVQLKALPAGRDILYIDCDGLTGDTQLIVDLANTAIDDDAGAADNTAIADSNNSYKQVTYQFTATSTKTATITIGMQAVSGTNSYTGDTSKGIYIDDTKYRAADQKRYTINGLVSTDVNLIDNIQQMVDAGAGSITYSEGDFFINPGAYDTPTVTIDESWLRGDMTIVAKKPRTELFNAVRGVFLDPDKNYIATDFPAVTNSTYETQDGGERLYTDAEFALVSDTYRAQRLAKILLERSRQGIVVEAPCNLYPLQLTAWQNVYVTISKLGWSSKVFKVMQWQFNANSGIDLILQEEASSSYSWSDGEATVVDTAPDTTLPNPNVVTVPTNLTLNSGTAHLFLRNDGTVFSRIYVSWDSIADIYVQQGGQIEIQYKKSTASDYEKWGFVGGEDTFMYILDVEDGVNYDVRIRAINSLNYKSDWVEVTGHTVVGKTAAPQDVPSLTVSQNGEAVLFRWSKVTDIDLGGYEIRYGLTNQTWAEMTVLTFATKGTQVTTVAVPPGTWKFCIKAIDTSENESTTALCQQLTVNNAQNVVFTKNSNNAWLGALRDYPYFNPNGSSHWFQNTSAGNSILKNPDLASTAGVLSIRVSFNSGASTRTKDLLSTHLGQTTVSGLRIFKNSGTDDIRFSCTSAAAGGRIDIGSSGAFSANTNYDLLFVAKPTGVYIYDVPTGNLLASNTTLDSGSSPSPDGTTLKLGQRYNGTSSAQCWDAPIYMLAVWDGEKTVTQAKQLDTQGLVHHYAFDEPGATTLEDTGNDRLDLSAVGGASLTTASRQSFSNPFGTINFHRNPLKGWLIPDDATAASGNNFDVFDNAIVSNNTTYRYKEPEIDLGRKDNLRVWIDTAYEVLSGQTLAPVIEESIDYADNTNDYDGYEDWAIGFINAQYYRVCLDMQSTAGITYITQFIPTFDVQERTESATSVNVTSGGLPITFATPFFDTPNITVTMAETGGKIPAAVSATNTGFTIYVYNSSGVAIDGVVNWSATGA